MVGHYVYEINDNCPADLSNNNSVGPEDLAAMLAAWGPCNNCLQDLNGDDVVDSNDLAILLGTWGDCP